MFQLLFGAADFVIESAGREATTFTGRTEIWVTVLAMTTNPLLGAGFQSFWLGDRLYKMWALFPVFRPNQAHNGYIEVYLNLGLLGLFIVGGVIVSTYRAARHRLATATDVSGAQFDEVVFAKFGMSYLMAFLLYNVTEATFQPLNLLFVVLLLVSFRVAPRSTVAREVGITKIEPMGAGVVSGSFTARGPNRWGARDRGSIWSPTASRRGGTPTRRDQFRVFNIDLRRSPADERCRRDRRVISTERSTTSSSFAPSCKPRGTSSAPAPTPRYHLRLQGVG